MNAKVKSSNSANKTVEDGDYSETCFFVDQPKSMNFTSNQRSAEDGTAQTIEEEAPYGANALSPKKVHSTMSSEKKWLNI